MTLLQYLDILRALCQMASIAAEGEMGEDAYRWKEKIKQILDIYYAEHGGK